MHHAYRVAGFCVSDTTFRDVTPAPNHDTNHDDVRFLLSKTLDLLGTARHNREETCTHIYSKHVCFGRLEESANMYGICLL